MGKMTQKLWCHLTFVSIMTGGTLYTYTKCPQNRLGQESLWENDKYLTSYIDKKLTI